MIDMTFAKFVGAGAVGLAILAGAAWSEDADKDDAKHLGVATCASSVCHGRVEPAENSYAALNEYRVWVKRDYHAGAYQLLHNETSKRIAANMGLPDAATAPECLACHTDYVPPEQRGERFHLSDGIGCEACHGGAENWIDTHYGPNASHADNLRAGLQPTEDPQFQARLCQSCHLGDDQRFASHEMMAAGHPRLRFELDTWLTLMPPHHIEDDDYRRRKGHTLAVERWTAGMVVAADNYLALLQRHLDTNAVMPELAVFDCHACHRPMDTSVFRPAAAKRLPAGAMRFNDNALQILTAIAEVRDPGLGRDLAQAIDALGRAATGSADSARRQARQLQKRVIRLGSSLVEKSLSGDERGRLTTTLLRRAGRGAFRDYADAEQLFLALQLLTVDPINSDWGPERYNGLYDLLVDEQAFDSGRFAGEARRLLQTIPTE